MLQITVVSPLLMDELTIVHRSDHKSSNPVDLSPISLFHCSAYGFDLSRCVDIECAFSVMDMFSSFPGYVEFIAPPEEIIVNDELFGEDIWLILKLELLFIFRSLLLPPENALCSWHRFSDLVRLWFMYSLFENLESGTLGCGVVCTLCMDSEDTFRHRNLSRQEKDLKFDVDTCCLDLCEPDCYGFLHLVTLICKSKSHGFLEHTRRTERSFPLVVVLDPFHIGYVMLLSQLHMKEIIFSSLMVCHERHASSRGVPRQGETRMIDGTSAGCYMTLFTFVERVLQLIDAHIISDVSYDDQSENEFSLFYKLLLVMLDASVQTFLGSHARIFLMDGDVFQLLASQVLPCCLALSTKLLTFDERLLDIIGHRLLDTFGHSGAIIEICYGSLPRPPEVHYGFSSKTLQFIMGFFKSKMQVPSILRGSIRYYDVVYTLDFGLVRIGLYRIVYYCI